MPGSAVMTRCIPMTDGLGLSVAVLVPASRFTEEECLAAARAFLRSNVVRLLRQFRALDETGVLVEWLEIRMYRLMVGSQPPARNPRPRRIRVTLPAMARSVFSGMVFGPLFRRRVQVDVTVRTVVKRPRMTLEARDEAYRHLDRETVLTLAQVAPLSAVSRRRAGDGRAAVDEVTGDVLVFFRKLVRMFRDRYPLAEWLTGRGGLTWTLTGQLFAASLVVTLVIRAVCGVFAIELEAVRPMDRPWIGAGLPPLVDVVLPLLVEIAAAFTAACVICLMMFLRHGRTRGAFGLALRSVLLVTAFMLPLTDLQDGVFLARTPADPVWGPVWDAVSTPLLAALAVAAAVIYFRLLWPLTVFNFSAGRRWMIASVAVASAAYFCVHQSSAYLIHAMVLPLEDSAWRETSWAARIIRQHDRIVFEGRSPSDTADIDVICQRMSDDGVSCDPPGYSPDNAAYFDRLAASYVIVEAWMHDLGHPSAAPAIDLAVARREFLFHCGLMARTEVPTGSMQAFAMKLRGDRVAGDADVETSASHDRYEDFVWHLTQMRVAEDRYWQSLPPEVLPEGRLPWPAVLAANADAFSLEAYLAADGPLAFGSGGTCVLHLVAANRDMADVERSPAFQDCIDLLLDAGLRADRVDDQGRTVLERAVRAGNLPLMESLPPRHVAAAVDVSRAAGVDLQEVANQTDGIWSHPRFVPYPLQETQALLSAAASSRPPRSLDHSVQTVTTPPDDTPPGEAPSPPAEEPAATEPTPKKRLSEKVF